MKKLILIPVLLLLCVIGYSQSDTLYTKKQQKIPCKIVEINEFDIKYKPVGVENGPLYVINKTTITKYTLSNGFTELLLPDELSLENEHAEIIKNRSAIKLQPFSIVNRQISLAYEKVIKVGMNIDVELGYVNSSLNNHPLLDNGNYGNVFNTGAYIKPGVKFFLGQDYSIRGLRYAHPLKGRYIKLDLAFSFLNFQNIQRVVYSNSYPNPTPYPIPVQTISSNLNSFAYGGFVNYGRQFILGNILTFEYYIGLGFTGQSNTYSNPEYLKASNNIYGGYYNEASGIYNYHGFVRFGSVGLSGTAGFRIGYILPDKKTGKSTGVK